MRIKHLMILIGFVMIGAVPLRAATNLYEKSNQPMVKVVKSPKKSSQGEYSHDWKAYPKTAKKPGQAKVLVERETPKTVRPNQDYTYIIKVTNKSYFKVDNVIVTEKLPAGFKLQKAVPAPEIRGNDLKWNLGIMAPDQKEIITVTGRASQTGKLVHRGNSKVNFSLNPMFTMTEVVEPSLHISAKNYPDKVIVGEVFPVQLAVVNVGSTTISDAKLANDLPYNMVTNSGDRKISRLLGSLELGQTKLINLKLKALKTGSFDNRFVVTAKDGVTAKASVKILAQKPNLKLTMDAPKMRFVGNVIHYNLKITNVGDGDAKNLEATLQIPGSIDFVSANEGGKQYGRRIQWRLASLEPKESKELDVRVKAKEIKNIKAVAKVQAFAATPREASVSTSVEGIAALLLEVDDINDPVPVGETETYVIKVTNQGSLPATNIRISCDLEDSMQFKSSKGPTKVVKGLEDGGKSFMKTAKNDTKAEELKAGNKKLSSGNKVIFLPLKSLAPGKEAVWRVVIKALKEGDFRFNVNVVSDQLTRPVSENESTTFYND